MTGRAKPNQCPAVLGDVRCGRAVNESGKHGGRCSARVNMEWYAEHTTAPLVQFVTYIGYGTRRIRALVKEVRL